MTIPVQFRFTCLLCKESITLPRHSPLGFYAGSEYNPSPLWPINLLCYQYQQVSKCPFDMVQTIPLEKQVHVVYPAAVWQIVGDCGQDCDTTPIYIWESGEASTDMVMNIVLKANPTVLCSCGHDIQWQAETMKATMLPF